MEPAREQDEHRAVRIAEALNTLDTAVLALLVLVAGCHAALLYVLEGTSIGMVRAVLAATPCFLVLAIGGIAYALVQLAREIPSARVWSRQAAGFAIAAWLVEVYTTAVRAYDLLAVSDLEAIEAIAEHVLSVGGTLEYLRVTLVAAALVCALGVLARFARDGGREDFATRARWAGGLAIAAAVAVGVYLSYLAPADIVDGGHLRYAALLAAGLAFAGYRYLSLLRDAETLARGGSPGAALPGARISE